MPRNATLYLRSAEAAACTKEAWRLSALDVVVPANYNNYAIIFKARDANPEVVVETFKRALEATLQQCRHLAGTIQANEFGDYSIVKTPHSAVKFGLNWLDDADEFPSFDNLEGANFTLTSLGNHCSLSVPGMPDSRHPDEEPAVLALQLNFIRGGFVLTTHVHHFALDMAGTCNAIQQLARNCTAVINGAPAPTWDEALMDRSRFAIPDVKPEARCDAPPRPPRNTDWRPCSWLLFHLQPQSAAQLKDVATSAGDVRISTYDAVTALCWRIIVRNRAAIYGADLGSTAIFGQPMDMRRRSTPRIPTGYQGNALAAGLSFTQPSPLTLGDVISEAPLHRMAAFIRGITQSVDEHSIEQTIARVAPYRKKADLDMPLDSLPPLSFTTTDWRSAKLAHFDFGIGQPVAYRCLYNAVVENMMILYPPHRGIKTGEQGIEVMLPFENHAIDVLLQDPDLRKWFEYRGVEVAS